MVSTHFNLSSAFWSLEKNRLNSRTRAKGTSWMGCCYTYRFTYVNKYEPSAESQNTKSLQDSPPPGLNTFQLSSRSANGP